MSSTSRRDALRLLAAGGVASVAGCSSFGLGSGPNEKPPESLGTSWSPSADAWPFRFRDPQNTARSPHGVASKPSVEWTDDPGSEESSAGEDGDLVAATPTRVFAATESEDGVRLRALAADDGARQWDRRLESPEDHPLPRYGGLVDGTLYVSGLGNDVVAVDAADGAVRWRRNLYEQVADAVPEKYLSRYGSSEGFSTMPLATPDTVLVQTPYGIHGLAPSEGTEQWRVYLARETDDPVLARPFGLAVTDGRVWASYGSPTKLLFAVSVDDDGLSVWQTHLPFENAPGNPVATGDRTALFATGVEWSTSPVGTLAAGVRGPTVDWQFPGHAGDGAAVYSRLATDGERAFVCQATERPERLVVSALRVETGKLDWSHRESLADRGVSVANGQSFRLCQPVVAGDSLVVGFGPQYGEESGRGTVLALSRDAGRVQWRTDLSVAPREVMVTSEGLYVGGHRGGVVALASESGD